MFRSRTTPSAFFDWRTSTSRRSVAWVNTSAGFLLSEPLRSRGNVESLNAFQVWRPACNGQEAEFELAHCRVNVESGNTVMRTTAAIIERTLTSDCGSRHDPGREMGDALLRYRPVFYRSAFRYLGNAADAAQLARARTRLRLLMRKRLNGPISRPPSAQVSGGDADYEGDTGQKICMNNLETLNSPGYSRRRSRKSFRRSDGGTQIA